MTGRTSTSSSASLSRCDQPETTTVPIANSNLSTAAGDAVQWDSAQAGLFHDLNTDTPVPKRLIIGSHLQG